MTAQLDALRRLLRDDDPATLSLLKGQLAARRERRRPVVLPLPLPCAVTNFPASSTSAETPAYGEPPPPRHLENGKLTRFALK